MPTRQPTYPNPNAPREPIDPNNPGFYSVGLHGMYRMPHSPAEIAAAEGRVRACFAEMRAEIAGRNRKAADDRAEYERAQVLRNARAA